ncbi:hypothetical protein GS876_23415 [Rhodococcus hoagii]|nr:hypothetical protein [Prescottella equi]
MRLDRGVKCSDTDGGTLDAVDADCLGILHAGVAIVEAFVAIACAFVVIIDRLAQIS